VSFPLGCKYGMTGISGEEGRKTNREWSPTVMLAVGLRGSSLLSVGSGPQAKLPEGTCAHLQASLLPTSFLFDECHVPIKRQHFSMQPFDRYLLDEGLLVVDLKARIWRID
jgi:hypothetical protein